VRERQITVPISSNPINYSNYGAVVEMYPRFCALERENFKNFTVVLTSKEFVLIVWNKDDSDKHMYFTAVEKS